MLRKAKTYASWLERKDMWRQSQKTFKKKQREIDRMSAGYGRAHFDVGPLSSAAEPEPSRAQPGLQPGLQPTASAARPRGRAHVALSADAMQLAGVLACMNSILLHASDTARVHGGHFS